MRSGERHSGLTRVRFIAALVVLFTFAFQTYVVQTHIHTAHFETGVFGQVNHPSPPGKDNSNKNTPDECPICQAFATAGSFVTPALIVLALALSFVDASPIAARRIATAPLLARNWRSRAPPTH